MTYTRPVPSTTTSGTTTDYTTVVSRVRRRLGDDGGVDGARRIFLTDEEIADIYTNFPGEDEATAEAGERILAQLALLTDKNVGGMSTSVSQAFNQYQQFLERVVARI